MKTKAIIFDYDGVLVDSLDVVHEIYKEIIKYYDKPLFRDVKKNIDSYDVDWKKTLEKVGITKKEDLEKIKNIYKKHFEINKDLTKQIPGMKKVLEKLKGNYRLAVASNNFKNLIEDMLKRFGILKYFDIIEGGEKEILKPDPAVIINCMNHLKVKPEETIYIGDMDGDIIAARNAKLKKMIAVTYGYHSHKK